MARRRKQDQAFVTLAGIAIILAIPIWIISKTADAIGSAAVFIIAIALIVAFFVLRSRARAARRAQLFTKYGDPNIVELIMQHRFWQGQTHYQLIDSLGNPAAVDDHMLKTKKRQVWKYHRTGHNRYKLRLTLENDIVVGYEKKTHQ